MYKTGCLTQILSGITKIVKKLHSLSCIRKKLDENWVNEIEIPSKVQFSGMTTETSQKALITLMDEKVFPQYNWESAKVN